MTLNSMLFTDIHNIPQPITIYLPDSSYKIVTQIENIMLTSNILLQNVLYVPYFKHNLLSIDKLLDQNKLIAKFDQNHCFFEDLSTDTIQAIGKRIIGLYRFQSLDSSSTINSSICFYANSNVKKFSYKTLSSLCWEN